jgi:hypothetical protein
MKNRYFFLALICLSGLFACKKEIESASFGTTKELAAGIVASQDLVANEKAGPMGVCYVEVNRHNILNTAAYTLKNGGQRLFDVAIIFAANINYDVARRRAVLYNNNNVTKVLTNRDTYVKPLQDKGLKVLLSILGNHQGAGISNFTSRAAARDFAQQLAQTVATYNLDGIDLDDEFSNYGNNGTGQPNDSSFVMLTEELRAAMPDKIISFYYFGPATSRQSWNGKRAGDYLNYSWNANYGTYSVPNVPPLTKSQLGPAATWINNTLQPVATTNAIRTATEGYGIYLYYDLHGSNEENYLSGPAFGMYGDSAKLATPIQSWTEGIGPDAPASLQVTSVGSNNATFNWSTVTGATSYQVEYKTSTGGSWLSASAQITSTSVTVSGLAPTTVYDWRVKTTSANGSSTYSFDRFSTTALKGVRFFQEANYGGVTTQEIPKGTYTLAQLQAYGFIDNWASSAQLPEGWTVTMFSNDNFKRTSWTLTTSQANFANLIPSANDLVTSVRIQ